MSRGSLFASVPFKGVRVHTGCVFPYTYKGANPILKTRMVDMALNGSGIRDTARVLGINRNTVMAQIKKKP